MAQKTRKNHDRHAVRRHEVGVLQAPPKLVVSAERPSAHGIAHEIDVERGDERGASAARRLGKRDDALDGFGFGGWPLDPDGLATELSNAEKVAALRGEDGIAYAAAKLGQELLGFHGIEFILFRDGKNRTVAALQANEDHEAFAGKTVTGEQELIYAAAVAGDLRDNCYRLLVSWNPNAPKEYADRCEELEVATTVTGSDLTYGENLLGAAAAGSSYKTWQSAMASILIAGCSNICAEVADVKMGNAHSGEDVNYIESPYSKKSFQDFIDNILSIQYSLYGAAGATSAQAHSLMSFFKSQGYSGAASLQSALDASLAALKACQAKGAFVDIYTYASVQKAMDEISALDDEINKAADWILRQ